MELEQNASGEDALRGWMVAAYASKTEKFDSEKNPVVLQEAYEKMKSAMITFLPELQANGWHTDRFLDGKGIRFGF